MVSVLSGCVKEMPTETSDSDTNSYNRVVTSEQAQEFARQTFGSLITFNGDEKASVTRSTAVVATETITLSSNGIPTLYVINFTDDAGFMVISADKGQANPVLMFSDMGNFELSMLEEDSPFAKYLNGKMDVVAENISRGSGDNSDSYAKWEHFGSSTVNEDGEEIENIIELVSVASLDDDVRLEALEQRQAEYPQTRARYGTSKGLPYISPWDAYRLKWGQKNGYNADAFRPNEDAAGCAAVAIGQMCFFNKFPTYYPYSSMPYSLPATTVSNPISRMLRNIGDKIPWYDWGPSTGAYNSTMLTAIKALGYSDAQCLDYDFYRTYTHMEQGYPVIFSAFGVYQGEEVGHAWLCNGYQEFVWKYTKTTKLFGIVIKRETWYEYADYLYMNWGWYGNGNAWVDQEDWRSQHPTKGEIKWDDTRKGFYDLFPR